MEGRKMFTPLYRRRGAGPFAPGEHCFDDTKLYFSVTHFSVFVLVQANLTMSSQHNVAAC
jgi:hypothetical protein